MENTHYILIKGGVLCLQHSEQFSKAMEPATYINDLSNPSKSILTSLERNNGDWNGFFPQKEVVLGLIQPEHVYDMSRASRT